MEMLFSRSYKISVNNRIELLKTFGLEALGLSLDFTFLDCVLA